MSAPIVMGDQIQGTCPGHLMPNPATGAPQPAGPLPFSAPLMTGLATTVTIGGQPAAVVGATGYNTPPHVGLHPSDPFLVPTLQVGTIVAGSVTVFIEGKPAATQAGQATCCATPGTLVPSIANVTID